MIKYTENRGKNRIDLAKINKEKIRLWFLKNQGGTQKDCQKETGLSLITIRKHLTSILNEQ